QTMSQPWIVACMTALLELDGNERVLEVGTGSGYGAAVLSRCCREVVTIERHAGLAERAAATLKELGYDNVEVPVGDGSRGAPDRAPFQGILVTAAAEQDPPAELVGQLAPGAALVCPVRRGHGPIPRVIRGGGEAGVAGSLSEKLGDVTYWYQRGGDRVLKIVSFFLFGYSPGTVMHHDEEV